MQVARVSWLHLATTRPELWQRGLLPSNPFGVKITTMATVFDVAKYILEKQGQMTTMKLQKLVYYSLAWSLVWDEKPLFTETVKAWANGPVVPDLYGKHKGMYYVEAKHLDAGDSSKLTISE